MKVIWESTDIKAGLVVGRPDRQERWIIGYTPKDHPLRLFYLISLNDGLIQKGMLAAEMADELNARGELPTQLLPVGKP